MSFRRRTTKPSVALWMLVAVGDVLLILAGMGTLIALVSVVTIAVAATGAWLLMRRGVPARNAVSSPTGVPVVARVRTPVTARRRA
ncbi:hypothetical protein [Micromonospora zhanjiangensis]|uniref:MYXO-CTERM domain-containing protein n=1 Tax=Micromonospora zhanjiangensis TaxID=1522057 RepID=A0ABV8KLL2_9ACTN